MKVLKLALSQAQIALLAHCVNEWQKQQKPVSADLQARVAKHCNQFGALTSPASTSQVAVDIELDFLRQSLDECKDEDTEFTNGEVVGMTL